MATKPDPSTDVFKRAQADLRRAVLETLDSLDELRKAVGIPVKHRPGRSPLELKRLAAGELMGRMGYRIDYSDQKSGGPRIVGPGFDAVFADIADFDGTDNNAICDSR